MPFVNLQWDKLTVDKEGTSANVVSVDYLYIFNVPKFHKTHHLHKSIAYNNGFGVLLL